MRARLSALGIIFIAALLAACGGGGGGTPAPRPTPTNNSYRPAASGDAFGYAGTMTEQFVRPPVPNGGITPSPNPQNTETLTYGVTQTVAVSTAATFQSVVNPYDFHVAESDVLAGGLKTSTVTTDDYYVYAASGASKTITFAGSNATTSDGNTYLDVTGTGNGLVDVLPEVTGTLTPANTAARTTTETDADGTTDVRAINADGSYTDNGTYLVGPASAAILNSDGSGSYSFQLEAPVNSSYTVTAPTAVPSAGENIGITITLPAALVTANPAPNATPFTFPTFYVPVWYQTPLVLSNESLVDNGPTTLPTACDVPTALTRSPRQLIDTKSTVDPVFGETDVTTTTTYTEPGIGVACVQLNDVVDQYYDLSGQAQFNVEGVGPLGFFAGVNTPFQTTTTTETLGITSATVVGLTAVERASQIAVRAGIARFNATLAHRRLQRHAAFRSALLARFKGGLR